MCESPISNKFPPLFVSVISESCSHQQTAQRTITAAVLVNNMPEPTAMSNNGPRANEQRLVVYFGVSRPEQ